jgi:4-amino-4-deoxy-L-arabinose transferase-like glycosyltransferase
MLKDMGKQKDWIVYAALLLVLIVIRFPSFFFSVFDWDESTLIIMGQSILNGHIPYVTAWDIKPPLAFSMYALFIAIFGKSLLAIRLGGLLCIYIASLLVYNSGKVLLGKTAGIIAALFLMVFVSSGPSGLSTMTEHMLLVPISWALYLLVARRVTIRSAFFTGLLFGAGILIKTSLIFESLAVLTILLSGYANSGTPLSLRAKQCAAVFSGMAIPLISTLCYFSMHNAFDPLIRTNVTAVLQYTDWAASFSGKLEIFLLNIRYNLKLNPLLWITFIFGTAYLFIKGRRRFTLIAVPLIIFTFQIVSLFMTAQPFGHHYLFTYMPVMATVDGISISQWLSLWAQRKGRTVYHIALVTVLVCGFFYSLQSSTVKYYGKLRSNLIGKKPLGDDSCSRIARFLNSEGVRNRYVYMVNSCQIVYWLTGSLSPTKYIHPSNLLIKDYLIRVMDGPGATRENELLAILAKHPQFIVQRTDLWPKELHTFRMILDKELRTTYELVKTEKIEKTIDGRYEIYRRKGNSR